MQFSINVDKSIRSSAAIAAQKEKVTKKKLEELQNERAAAKEAEEKKAEEERTAKEAAEQPEAPQSPSQSAGIASSNCNRGSSHRNPESIDVLVNKKHCLAPLSFVPPDLVTTHGATLSAKAAGSFNAMFAAAAAAGQPFTISSSYRSYQTQVSTYSHWVSVNGQAGADTVSARPGFSEHQTGFVIDVGAGGCNLNCFGGTTQYQWFQENAAQYGFIQRYYGGFEAITGYASEEWHYRYVGTAVAEDMKARGIKTLEQYWGLEGGDYR